MRVCVKKTLIASVEIQIHFAFLWNLPVWFAVDIQFLSWFFVRLPNYMVVQLEPSAMWSLSLKTCVFATVHVRIVESSTSYNPAQHPAELQNALEFPAQPSKFLTQEDGHTRFHVSKNSFACCPKRDLTPDAITILDCAEHRGNLLNRSYKNSGRSDSLPPRIFAAAECLWHKISSSWSVSGDLCNWCHTLIATTDTS